MANHDDSSKATSSAMCNQALDPCHKRFSWLPAGLEGSADAQYAATVVDLTRGTFVIATILRQHLVDLNAAASSAGASVKTLLNANDMLDLAALMEVSLGALREMTGTKLESIDNTASKGQQA
jgi:hypothetical protein